MDYILTYDGNKSNILSNGFIFESTQRPEVDIEFDSIFYETPTANSFKVLNNFRYELTPEEVQACREYCDTFADNQDYMVSTYDPDTLVYTGLMPKSEAIEKKLEFVVNDEPDHPAVKFLDGGWKYVKAVIREDGSYSIDPPSICDSCVMFFTSEEWDEFEYKPQRSTDRYNFIVGIFEDQRRFDTLKYMAETDVRNYFERIRWNEWNKFIPQYEQATWNIQVEEARSYLRDTTSDTPYIDTFLEARTDDYVPTKEVFVKDVLENNRKFIVAMAGVNAQQWSWLKRIDHCTTNDELDSIIDEISELNSRTTRPMYKECSKTAEVSSDGDIS